MFLLIVVLLICTWSSVIWWRNREKRRIYKTVKSDFMYLPVVGSAYRFLGTNEDRMKLLQDLGRTAIKNNGWTSLWLWNLFVFVADPVEAEFVLKTYLEKDDITKVLRDLFRNGSIYASVQVWKPRRKVIAPTFTMRNLNQFSEIFQQQSHVLVKQLREVVDQGTFSLWKYLTSYTINSICETTLGIRLGASPKGNHPFVRNFEIFAEIAGVRLVLPWLQNDFLFQFSEHHAKNVEAIRVMSDFVLKIIKSKRASLKENKDKNEGDRRESLLKLLIEASGGDNGFTDNELLEETLVMVAAGTDTSAVAVGYAAVLLSQYPDVQEKVYQELLEVCGDSDKPITAEKLPRLKYLEAVIKETMRLYPPAPLTVRRADRECITPGGLKLSPGVAIVIHQWAIHRNPRYWGADAEVFRPERFFDSPPTHPAAFMPFSYGPRNCLGLQYAMMSMKTAIGTILRKYKILPGPEITDKNRPLRVKFDFMMKHVNNYEIRIQSRHPTPSLK